MRKLKAFKIFGILITMMFFINGYKVYANERIDINRKSSLEVIHSYTDKPLENVKFDIYKIANITSALDLEIVDDFKKYPIDFDSIEDESQWYLLADTLSSYVKVDNIQPVDTLITNEEGKAIFSDLDVGIYLVVGESTEIDDNIYETKPSLVSLPILNLETGEYIYDVSINTKSDESAKENIDLTVEKKWVNDEEKGRPESINVSLYCNGSLYDKVILSQSNNWKHQWFNLDKKAEWTIIEEDVSDKYTVTYEKYGEIITITNTYKEDSKPEGNGNLPHTGQLLGATAILIIGLALIIVGYFVIRKPKSNRS